MTQMNPYLNFAGAAAAAMTFYQSVFGGDLAMSTYAEFGMTDDPADEGKTMHSQLETAEGWILMGADLPASIPFPNGNTASVSLSGGPDEFDKLSGWFGQMSDGGQVLQPLEQAPWGDHFGSCVDRFGTSWMFNIGGTPPTAPGSGPA